MALALASCTQITRSSTKEIAGVSIPLWEAKMEKIHLTLAVLFECEARARAISLSHKKYGYNYLSSTTVHTVMGLNILGEIDCCGQ
eukprot:8139787-Pyramimonas_sp.AAC.1